MTQSRALALFVCCLIWNSPVLEATINAGGSLQAGEQVILRLVLPDTNGTSGLTGNFNWIAVQ